MLKSNRFLVVGIGEILWDVFPDGKRLGGAPANFAWHAAQFGADARIASCVGNDGDGSEILQQLGAMRLDTGYIGIDNTHATGTVTVKLDSKGMPGYVINENVAWDFIGWNENLHELALKADAVCYGTLCQRSEISRNTILKFLETTCRDCLRIYDINLRQHYYNREIVQRALELASVFKINNEELPVVAGLLGINGTENEILYRLSNNFRLELIVLTRGKNGSLLYSPSHSSEHQPLETEAVDSVGAGDSFTAAAAIGLLNGYSLDSISVTANRTGSFVCTQKGATPKIPEELLKFD